MQAFSLRRAHATSSIRLGWDKSNGLGAALNLLRNNSFGAYTLVLAGTLASTCDREVRATMPRQ